MQSEWPGDQDTFILGIDLGDPYFLHAIRLITDLDIIGSSHFIPEAYPDTKDWFQNVRIFIGNSPNYLENEQCGGIFLADPSNPNDPDYTSVYSSWSGTGNMWSFGLEAWCNMEGRYLHFEAKYAHILTKDATVSICTLGVMGTKYVRDTPVPTEVTL